MEDKTKKGKKRREKKENKKRKERVMGRREKEESTKIFYVDIESLQTLGHYKIQIK